jgi:hypothetical protein
MVAAELIALGTIVTGLRPIAHRIHFSHAEKLKLPATHELIVSRPTDNSRPRSTLDHAILLPHKALDSNVESSPGDLTVTASRGTWRMDQSVSRDA